MNLKKSLFVSFLMTFAGFAAALYFAFTIDGEIPIHWNISGEIDGYGSPAALLLFPTVSLCVCLLLYFLPALDPKGENIKKSAPLLPALILFISALMIIMEAVTVCIVLGIKTFDMSTVIMFLLGVMFIMIGAYLPKVKPNYMMGIRTPWTLASEEVWTKTHKESGKWFIASGVMFFIGLFLSPPLNILIPLGFILASTVGITVYSYVLFNNIKKKDNNY